MKNIILGSLISLFFTLFLGNTFAQTTADVVIDVSGLKSNKGKCYYCLHNKAKSFPTEADKAYKCGEAIIKNNTSKIIFENVPIGTYAVAVFHDENANNTLDTNFMGIPKEGLGFSNNAKMGTFGPPSFEKAKWEHSNKGSVIKAKISY